MRVDAVPPALQDHLGPEATVGLLALFETAHQEWAAEVTTLAVERFERRLTEEISGLRVEIAQSHAALRLEIGSLGEDLRTEIREGDVSLKQELGGLGSELRLEMSELGSKLRQEISDLGSKLRQEMGDLGSNLRQEMADLGSKLRQETSGLGANLRQEMNQLATSLRAEMSDLRFDLLKWSFVFWVGQVIAMAGLLGLMFRLFHTT